MTKKTATRLYDVLVPAFPNLRKATGALNLKALAEKLGLSAEALYKGLRSDRITVATAQGLVAVSDGRLTTEALHAYVFA
jgi:hypothetical protein